jgi:hypothetical protein
MATLSTGANATFMVKSSSARLCCVRAVSEVCLVGKGEEEDGVNRLESRGYVR